MLTALRAQGRRDFVFTNIDHDGMLDGPDREEVVEVAAQPVARTA